MLRKILKLCLPPVLFSLINFLHSICKSGLKNKSTLKYFKSVRHDANKICILANGPSLNASIEKYKYFIEDIDCIAVNHFAESSHYSEIKPNIYVIADPYYFIPIELIPEQLKEIVINCIHAIRDRTKWSLAFIIPVSGKNSYLENELKKNAFISIYYYNTVKRGFFFSETGMFKCWDKNIIAPPAQTVINTCIYLALFWNYGEVYLFGADTSWHEDLLLDQETNQLFIRDKHFYGEKLIPLYSDDAKLIKANLFEELQSISNALRLYNLLERYSKFKGNKVFNSSEKSWIDAFERKKLPLENE